MPTTQKYQALPAIGFVSLEKRGKSYQIRFRHASVKNGDRVAFSLGKISEAEAIHKQTQINLELSNGTFDLLQYSRKARRELSPIQRVANQANDTYKEHQRLLKSISKDSLRELLRYPKGYSTITLKEVLLAYQEANKSHSAGSKARWVLLDKILAKNPEFILFDNRKEFLAHLKKTYTISTVKNLFYSYLLPALNYAVDTELIQHHNYSALIKTKEFRSTKPQEVDCYSIPEIEEIILPTLEKIGTPEIIYKYIQLSYLLGTRPSELLAITPKDIRKRGLHISKAICRITKKIQESTKTGTNRTIPLNSKIRNILASLPQEEIVFPHNTTRLQQRMVNYYWNKAINLLLESGSIDRKIKLYSLRATFITNLLSHGYTYKQVAKIVGNTPAIILKHYERAEDVLELPM